MYNIQSIRQHAHAYYNTGRLPAIGILLPKARQHSIHAHIYSLIPVFASTESSCILLYTCRGRKPGRHRRRRRRRIKYYYTIAAFLTPVLYSDLFTTTTYNNWTGNARCIRTSVGGIRVLLVFAFAHFVITPTATTVHYTHAEHLASLKARCIVR